MRTPAGILFVPLLVLLGGGACGPADAPGNTGLEVSDSAGVTIVRNGQPEVPLDLEEVLRVGVVEGDPEEQFNRIRTLTVDPAGGFWVVDANESVRHYGPGGRYTHSVGGRGSGPGESEMYYSATLDGDRVLLFGVPGVLQLFDAEGSLLGSKPRDEGPAPAPVGAVDGNWILQRRSYPDDGREVFRSEETFLVARGLEGPRDTVGTFHGQLGRVVGGEGGFRGIGRASWFHGNPAFGVDGRGRIFVSDTLRYRIETWDLEGRLRRILERTAEPRAFDPDWLADLEAGFEEAHRSAGRPIDRERLAEQMASATPDPTPVHLPFIEGLLVGPSGELWVERADRHPRPALRAVAHQYGYIRHAWLPGWAAPRVYDVFDSEGRYEGTVELPEDFAPMAVVGSRVYGVHYDELDVERVVVHEVRASG